MIKYYLYVRYCARNFEILLKFSNFYQEWNDNVFKATKKKLFILSKHNVRDLEIYQDRNEKNF